MKPVEFEDIDLRQVELLAQGTRTDTFMARFFRVSVARWKEWRQDHSELEAILQEGYSVPKARAEASLFELVIGFVQIEEVFEATGDFEFVRRLDIGELMVVPQYRKRIKKTTMAPNITAIKYFLNNVAPDEWRDRLEVTDENKKAMGQKILEARGRSEKFQHQRELVPVNGT